MRINEKKLTEQERLKLEYERQQTPEGQAALQVKRDLLRKFRNINGSSHINAGEVQPLYDAKTGKILQYYKVL